MHTTFISAHLFCILRAVNSAKARFISLHTFFAQPLSALGILFPPRTISVGVCHEIPFANAKRRTSPINHLLFTNDQQRLRTRDEINSNY